MFQFLAVIHATLEGTPEPVFREGEHGQIKTTSSCPMKRIVVKRAFRCHPNRFLWHDGEKFYTVEKPKGHEKQKTQSVMLLCKSQIYAR